MIPPITDLTMRRMGTGPIMIPLITDLITMPTGAEEVQGMEVIQDTPVILGIQVIPGIQAVLQLVLQALLVETATVSRLVAVV